MDKLKELNVELIVADDTHHLASIATDLARSDRANLPVNLIYPPNYPIEPAILLKELVKPADVLKVLERMEKIQDSMNKTASSSSTLKTVRELANKTR